MKLLLGFFIAAAGFVTAALLWNAGSLKSGSKEGFDLKSRRPTGIIGRFVYLMFAGPYMIADSGVTVWKRGELNPTVLVFSLLLAVLWSFCSGIFVVQMLVLTGAISI